MRMIRFTQVLTLAIVISLCFAPILAIAEEPSGTPQNPPNTVEEATPQPPPKAPEEAEPQKVLGAPEVAAPQEAPHAPETTAPDKATNAPEEAATQKAPKASEKPAPVSLEDISIVSTRPQERPEGTAISSAPRRELDLRPTRSFLESLQAIPGVTTQQGNGPRDFNLSIRGFGAKTAFGIRNVKFYEDGINQTQSDGLSRLDLHDPWFMQGVEVLRGPSSSQYDNYALGGVFFFRTRRGSDIMGTEVDATFGSFGYRKAALAYGWNTPTSDVALFASHILEEGYIRHSDYNTTTENLNFRYHIDDRQDIYFKFINNDLDTDVPTRLTLNQFYQDPRQSGGLGSQTALSLAQHRKDRRTILGALYERQLDSRTVFTMEGDFDVKDINQTFSTIAANINPNFKTYADLRHDGYLFGAPLRSTVGFFFNYMEQESDTYTNTNDFTGNRGPLQQNVHGSINNMGGRARAEWEFIPHWTAAAGIGVEVSTVKANVINYCNTVAACASFPGPPTPPGQRTISPDLTYRNYAPEVSLTHRMSPGTKQWIRLSTGYGIPGISNLTTDLTGGPGINTGLKPQKNVGFEIGSDTQISSILSLQLVGFWTVFKDEIITQNTTIGSYSINADRSQYRGIEAGATVKPFKGARITGAYTFLDATYRQFNDQYLVGGVPTLFNRGGNQVPAVVRNFLYTQTAYDHPSGLGTFVETTTASSYFADNANTLKAPAYTVVNANLHYIHPFPETSWFHFIKTFIEMDNVLNRTYVQSTAVVSDSPCGATPTTDCMNGAGQAFFTGYGRSVYGGVTVGF